MAFVVALISNRIGLLKVQPTGRSVSRFGADSSSAWTTRVISASLCFSGRNETGCRFRWLNIKKQDQGNVRAMASRRGTSHYGRVRNLAVENDRSWGTASWLFK